MKGISELMESLNVHFNWNKARIDCFTKMLLGLFAVKTVNLREIAIAFDSNAQMDSRYKRLKRFFRYFKIDSRLIAFWIFRLFFSNKDSFYLVIDRTNWFFGKQKINVFMLAVAYEGIAIPLFWQLLPKAGCSNFKEQKALLERFIETFGITGVQGLLADREFASGKLLKWLNELKIAFYIRIKEDSRVCIKRKKWMTAKNLFRQVQSKTQYAFQMNVSLFSQRVYLAGSRSERGELMIVATNRSPKNAIAIYLRRWEIENLFQSLKGRGFSFEETHVTKLDRIEKLIALLAVGLAWAHKVGEWRALIKPIYINQYRESQRPQYTYFRYGFDFIREAVLQIYRNKTQFKQCIRQIILPKATSSGLLL